MLFLNKLLSQNPDLADYAIWLHKNNKITPDTYVIDADSVLENTRNLLNESKKIGITLFAMTKQIGRNSYILEMLKQEGMSFVAVDFREVETLIQNKCALGHVGHLVQVPYSMIPNVLLAHPQFWTVYSYDQALEINRVAKSLGVIQNILLRPIINPYPSQESQLYNLEDFIIFANKIRELENIQLAGLTTFPALLYNNGKVETTENAVFLNQCFDTLNKEGFNLQIKNMPSHNNLQTLALMKELGATHGEPGHALTGTCPSNVEESCFEKIALCYVTEISHHGENLSYAYGGGWYRRSHWSQALIGFKRAILTPPSNDSIDYTFSFQGKYPIGESVLAAFRTQIFITRSRVAVVSGLSLGKPTLLGIADSLGRKI